MGDFAPLCFNTNDWNEWKTHRHDVESKGNQVDYEMEEETKRGKAKKRFKNRYADII